MKQILYKPKKEKVVPVAKTAPEKDITFQDVMRFWQQALWYNRVFILVTILILENVYLLVKL